MIESQQALPVLYSFRRCPYAIRARMALRSSGVKVELREIILRHKPLDMLERSPKGTVPVLAFPDGKVIDESIDIMRLALGQSDPDGWMDISKQLADDTEQLIQENDTSFKQNLDRYKYAERFPEHPQEYYREQGEIFLRKLNQRLEAHPYLCGSRMTLADAAIFPFVRQFSNVENKEPKWFDTAPYAALQKWRGELIESAVFTEVMQKYQPWTPEISGVLFPE